MNEKMKNLKAKMAALLAAAKGYMEGEEKDIEKANAKMAEYNAAKAEYEAEKMIYEAEKEDAATKSAEQKAVKQEQEKNDKELDSVSKLAKAARLGFPKSMYSIKDMNEGEAVEGVSDGGYTVPEDISTRIEQFRDAKYSLRQDVSVENVTTMSGARTFQQRSQQTGFSEVGEGSKIGKKNTPKFTRLKYIIKKYGGIYVVTNELLADSDANIVDTIVEWIGNEERITCNVKILAEINAKWSTLTNFKDLDGIKKALNITLGQAFKPTSSIITNDNGLQYLATLKDGVGRDLLQPDPTAPANLRLNVGDAVIPIKVIPNADMPNRSGAASGKTRVPFIVGDMKEGIKLFDRKKRSIMSSTEASTDDVNAFEEDLTLWRGIVRFDVEAKDLAALVNGYIDVDNE